jgi:L-erythro-3,5-diaminohexanoate dehydrogenase
MDDSPLDQALGLHRVSDPGERLAGVLPQAAWRLDPSPEIGPGEVRVRVDRLNLDAASYRQLRDSGGGDGAAVREAVREIIASRGKMHNPVTGSGGMLTGVVEEALFGRSIAVVLPEDLPLPLVLSVMDVCGAPALTRRVVGSLGGDSCRHSSGRPAGISPASPSPGPVVAILGAAGKSGSLSAAAAREAGASRVIGVVPNEEEAALLRAVSGGAPASPAAPPPLVDEVVVADAREPVRLASLITARSAGGADVTVVCVDVPGCEGGAILATRQGGTVIFFSMATSFSAAALGAEGVAADVTMLVGNGYVPGHAEYALGLIRTNAAVRALFERRVKEVA